MKYKKALINIIDFIVIFSIPYLFVLFFDTYTESYYEKILSYKVSLIIYGIVFPIPLTLIMNKHLNYKLNYEYYNKVFIEGLLLSMLLITTTKLLSLTYNGFNILKLKDIFTFIYYLGIVSFIGSICLLIAFTINNFLFNKILNKEKS